MKLFLTLTAILCFLTISIVVYVWLGSYNIAASVPHWDITHWFLGKVRDQSISAHSRGIIVPSLMNPKVLNIGLNNYHAMCRLCHSAPGYSRTEVGKGLNPAPPDLVSGDTLKKRKDAELYWVVKNGIKMTGMPAFGLTHSEDELWGIVTFLRRLPKLQAEEYKTMVKAAGLRENEEDVRHGHK
jgi:mono/diheme cytochrome c family protein